MTIRRYGVILAVRAAVFAVVLAAFLLHKDWLSFGDFPGLSWPYPLLLLWGYLLSMAA